MLTATVSLVFRGGLSGGKLRGLLIAFFPGVTMNKKNNTSGGTESPGSSLSGTNQSSVVTASRLSSQANTDTAKLNTSVKLDTTVQSIAPQQSRRRINLEKIEFDPTATSLQLGWSSYAKTVCCVNAYPNGITLSVHSNRLSGEGEAAEENLDVDENQPSAKYSPQQFYLRFRDTRDYQLPVGKYFLYRDNFAQAFEQHLSQLHKSGELASTVFYFGTTSDPFMSFQKKFDTTMTCLELLEQYKPGFVVVQTRSPMIISALPLLKMMGEKVVVGIPVETTSESMVQRYMPGQPKISERLVSANGLRRQGIPVNLIVSPVLPYGDFSRDAWTFAELLEQHADYVTFGCLASGDPAEEVQLKELPVAKKLVADKHYRWLRPYAYKNVYYALTLTAPDKLTLPVQALNRSNQLNLFEAA